MTRTWRIALQIMFALSVLGAYGCLAQTNSGSTLVQTPPLPPFLARFEYWSLQFVQWPASTFPIWSIEVSVFADSNGKNALYDVVLEERANHKRSHYLSDRSLIPKIHEGDYYLSPIAVKKTEEDPLTYEFSFTDHLGRPVFWRFVQGSDVSDRGSGLTQIARQDARPLMLMYREQGAAAGQGTALQVGKDVSEAEIWKEISAPPYFVAYRGALTVGADIGVFPPGDVEWHVDQPPQSLSPGQSWKLSSKERWNGIVERRAGSLEITRVSGDSYTFLFKSESLGTCEIQADATTGHWRIRSVTYGGSGHGLVIGFQPGIFITAADNKESPTFEILMGQHKRVAEGSVTVTATPDGEAQFEWRFKNPNWAKTRRIFQKIRTGSGTVHIAESVQTQEAPKSVKPSPSTRRDSAADPLGHANGAD